MTFIIYLLDLILHSIVIAIVVSTIAFAIYTIYKKYRKQAFNNKLVMFVFFYYLCSLLYLTVYREGLFTNDVRTVNLEPFTILFQTFGNMRYNTPVSAYIFLFYNIFGNIIWFMPLGYFLDKFFKHMTWYKVGFFSLLLSASIELIQYLCYVGISDIDDLIFNSIGGVLGYLCYLGIKQIRRRKSDEYQTTSKSILEDFSK